MESGRSFQGCMLFGAHRRSASIHVDVFVSGNDETGGVLTTAFLFEGLFGHTGRGFSLVLFQDVALLRWLRLISEHVLLVISLLKGQALRSLTESDCKYLFYEFDCKITKSFLVKLPLLRSLLVRRLWMLSMSFDLSRLKLSESSSRLPLDLLTQLPYSITTLLDTD